MIKKSRTTCGCSRAKDGTSPMDGVLRRKQCFLLRLPNSLREQATQIAQEEGTSLNYFIGLALAEKISRMQQSRSANGSRAQNANPLQVK
jgi:hypothetical protein